ncbi:MAG: alpha/beta hydrolase [Geminicoccaceae bacterium]|nr:alpha/beta hydrolase [Geminicoccaceae bacterium]MDW8125575.1 alpha/beta hydrolase [Geminicoccaceae bacterium]
MPELDPAMAEILRMLERRALPPYETMPPAVARAECEVRNAFWNADPPQLPEIEDVTIEGPRGPLHLRLYVPEGAPTPSPAIVYVHGGGWVLGSLDTHDHVCRRLARAARVRLVSVAYGLAPEHPFPQGLADVVHTLRWLFEHGASEDIEPTAIAVAGDSAGANLALAACLRLRDLGEPLPRAAALVYGCYSSDFESPSHLAFGDGRYFLSTATVRWFWDHYLPDPAERDDPLASPLFADLRGLPPLFVSAAEFDPLRDDSERLARRLVEARVDFDWRLWRGVTHGCFQMSRMLARADRFIAEVAGFLVRNLG